MYANITQTSYDTTRQDIFMCTQKLTEAAVSTARNQNLPKHRKIKERSF